MGSNNGHDRSLSDLERDAERTRTELMHTVEALHHRVSPQALKAEAKEYVRNTGEGFLDAVQQKARENPLQAVAVAAGLAFPIWRLAASMPVPLLLIGAGLALGRSSGHMRNGHEQSYGEEFYHQAREKAESAVDAVRERVSDAAETVRGRVHDATQAVQQTVGAVQQKVSGVVDQATDQVTSGLRSAQDLASDTLGRAKETLDKTTAAASGLASQAGSIPSRIYGSSADAAQSGMQTARDSADHMAGQIMDSAYQGAAQMRDTGRTMQNNLIETIQQHPLLVGAVGLAAGAAIAAAFPSTRMENRVFGETADALKDQAQDLASEGAEFARTAASDLYRQALEEARAHGLSPEALRDAVKDLGAKAKAVAQNATGSTSGKPAHATTSSSTL